MSEVESTSVVVIGAGPVGLTLANLLAGHGLGVRILTQDAAPRPVEHSRAEGNHARTLAVYERLGVLGEALTQGRFVHSAVFQDGDRRIGTVDMDDPQSYYPGLGLGQARVERILAARLERADVAVEWGWTLTGLEQSDQYATATLLNAATDHTLSLRAPYVVACDGGNSTARKLLNASFAGDTSDIQYALADAQVIPSGEPYDDDMHMWFSPMMMLARLDGDYWRAVAPTDATKPLPDTPEAVLAAIQDRFDQNGVGMRIHSPRWTSMFRVNTRRVAQMRHGRIFLAGDSAHVHSPAGGQGMNEGIQDALNLSWKLAAVLDHGASDALLDTYDSERQPFIKDLLKETKTMTRFLEGTSTPLSLLRTAAITAVTHLGPLQPVLRQRITGSGRRLQNSVLIADPDGRRFPGKAPRPGERAPDARGLFADAHDHARRLFTLWEGFHGHELLIFAGEHETVARCEALSTLAQDIEARCGRQRLRARVVTRSGSGTGNYYLDSESDLLRRFRARTECLYLIRPDGFIGYRSASVNPDCVPEFLREKYGA